jgi:hypothetical protein
MATADQAQLANLAAMARSIFHQVGATEVAHPELTTLSASRTAAGRVPDMLRLDPLSKNRNNLATPTFFVRDRI